MRDLIFEGDTWQVYERLREKNRPAHRNLVRILKQLQRGDPTQGLGKPEPLRHSLSGLWSRRYTPGDRLVYAFDNDAIHIIGIGGHYD